MKNTITKDEYREYEEARKIYEKLSPNDRKIFESYVNAISAVFTKLLDAVAKAQ